MKMGILFKEKVMTEYASFDDLLGSSELLEDDVKLPNGMVVRVKALTRYEYTLSLKKASNNGEVDMPELEISLLRFGMMNPKLDANQAEKWIKTSPAGTVNTVLTKIRDLSKLGEDAEKSDVS